MFRTASDTIRPCVVQDPIAFVRPETSYSIIPQRFHSVSAFG